MFVVGTAGPAVRFVRAKTRRRCGPHRPTEGRNRSISDLLSGIRHACRFLHEHNCHTAFPHSFALTMQFSLSRSVVGRMAATNSVFLESPPRYSNRSRIGIGAAIGGRNSSC